jgi:drug/metabolite transporter (DMT)-like permease
LTGNTEGIFWALIAAVVLAFQGVASARSLRRMGVLAASVLTNGINVVVLGILGFIFYEEGQASLEGMAWFTLLGFTAYSFGRFVYYKGLFTIGPPRMTTIMTTAPLLALILAVLFLGERPGAAVLAGTGFVVFGVVLVSYEPTDEGWFHRGIGWGFASALSLGVSTFIRKKGIAAFPNPMLTVAWANLIGISVLLSFRKFTPPKLFDFGGRSAVIVIGLLAVLNSANQVFMNLAVMHGDVSVVTPIITSSPVFSILFTIILIRDLERVRFSMVMGVLTTVAGMIFIAMGR